MIVVPDGCRGPEGHHRLEPGQTLRFGRTEPADLGLAIPHPEVPGSAGEITATGAFWVLTNFSSDQTYLVENPESAGEHIRVAPGRADAPVPFEFARVTFPGSGARPGFDVLAPRHDYLAHPEVLVGTDEPGSALYGEGEAGGGRHGGSGGRDGDSAWGPVWSGCALGDPSPVPFPLDRTRRYFLVLAALCEPRLRGDAGAGTAPPSPEDVCKRLQDVWPGVDEEDVCWNIDYLGVKLRLKTGAHPPEAAGTERAEGLVTLALRFDLVREEHLGVLDGELV